MRAQDYEAYRLAQVDLAALVRTKKALGQVAESQATHFA